jgi:hypothetical protein
MQSAVFLAGRWSLPGALLVMLLALAGPGAVLGLLPGWRIPLLTGASPAARSMIAELAGADFVPLTSGQLAMLWEGIDWRRPNWRAPPARVG